YRKYFLSALESHNKHHQRSATRGLSLLPFDCASIVGENRCALRRTFHHGSDMVKRYANPDMKPGHSLLPWIVSLLFTLNAAATRYVDVNNTNATFPYTSWATAATNIQQAVDIAQTSEVILVTNGIYSSGGRLFGGSSNRVAIDGKVLTIQSVN